MTTLRFAVRSSSGDDYELTARQTASGVRFSCQCQGAEWGQLCKHRVSLMMGDTKLLSDGKPDEISLLMDWCRQDGVLADLDAISDLENNITRAKASIAKLKKKIASRLAGD